MDTRHADLYEADFHAWAVAQAAALRRMAEAGTASELDLANLAEEVEGLAGSDRNALRSHLRTLIEHLLKLEFSPAGQQRSQWRRGVRDARAELHDLLEASPSLRRAVGEDLPRQFVRARANAADGLSGHGEDAAALSAAGPDRYPVDRVLDEDWFPASRHGLP
jgi:hypothetical protein